MAKWTDNIDGEPYTSRGVRTVRRRAFGNTTIVIWQGAGCLAYIVANRINHNGKNTADHFKNYARTGEFCRRMEKELGLTQTPDMRINKPRGIEIPLLDKSHSKLKRAIDESLNSISSINELRKHLATKGYKTYTGRGIAFFDIRKKIKIKGSDLGRSYSLSAIEKRLTQSLEVGPKIGLETEIKTQKKRGIGM